MVVNELREQQKRNFIATLFLSQGVPMIVAGDEISRTQNGNNNAYCQDNEISWIDWEKADKSLLDFTKKIIAFYKAHPVFTRKGWFQGQPIKGVGVEDIAWFSPDAVEMTEENWNNDFAKSLAVYMNGLGVHSVGPKGERITDDSFYMIFNAYHDPLTFKLPPAKYGEYWIKVLDTHENFVSEDGERCKAGDNIKVDGRSIVVLKHPVKENKKTAG